MEDTKQWKAFQDGSATAFEQLFQEHWDRLMRYTCNAIQDQALAQDVLQNFFIELWQKKSTLPQPRCVPSFLLFVLKLRILNALRDEDLRSKHEDTFAALTGDISTTPGDVLYFKEVYQQLQQHLQQLPPRIRQVFYLSRFEHKNVAEIAATLGASEQTVRNQLNTARKRLRLQLKSSFISLLL